MMVSEAGTAESRAPRPVAARNLSYAYGRRSGPVLHGVDLELREGEIFGLLGPNGAGKSTLMRIFLGLLRGYSGETRVLNWPARRLPQRAMATIGYVSGDQDLPEWMSLDQLVRQLAPLYADWDETLCDDLCRRFELPGERPIRSLSRGQRMRARLVLALAHRPRLLFLDEPFAGLDPRVRNDVIDGVLEITGQSRWTVLLATHELSIVERLADRVGILVKGRMVLVDGLEALQRRSRRVHAELSEPLPDDFAWPESWRDRRIEGLRLRFLDLAAEEAETYVSQIPECHHADTARVSLEEIYLALDTTDDQRGEPS